MPDTHKRGFFWLPSFSPWSLPGQRAWAGQRKAASTMVARRQKEGTDWQHRHTAFQFMSFHQTPPPNSKAAKVPLWANHLPNTGGFGVIIEINHNTHQWATLFPISCPTECDRQTGTGKQDTKSAVIWAQLLTLLSPLWRPSIWF